MLKKMISAAIISGILLSGLALPPAWAGGNVSITVNGKKIDDAVVTFKYGPDGNPTGQVVLWPLRKVAEDLGYKVAWDGSRAIVSNDSKKVVVGPEDKVVLVYGQQTASTGELEVPTHMADDHIYVETDFFTKYLGAKLGVSK